jgi:hypothetical protein
MSWTRALLPIFNHSTAVQLTHGTKIPCSHARNSNHKKSFLFYQRIYQLNALSLPEIEGYAEAMPVACKENHLNIFAGKSIYHVASPVPKPQPCACFDLADGVT